MQQICMLRSYPGLVCPITSYCVSTLTWWSDPFPDQVWGKKITYTNKLNTIRKRYAVCHAPIGPYGRDQAAHAIWRAVAGTAPASGGYGIVIESVLYGMLPWLTWFGIFGARQEDSGENRRKKQSQTVLGHTTYPVDWNLDIFVVFVVFVWFEWSNCKEKYRV